MIRAYAIRLSGAILLLAAVCIALWVLPNLIPPLSILWEALDDSAIVVVNITLSAMLALGLLGLILAQRRWSGRLSALAALLGLLLYGALLLPRAIGLGALNVALTGAGLLAPLETSASSPPLPLLMLETLAALFFIGGLIACGLAARHESALRWWWTPLALGVWSLVISLLGMLFVLLFIDSGVFLPSASPQSPVFVLANYAALLIQFVMLLLWAFLAISLLTAPPHD